MTPDHPLITVVVALVVLAGMVLLSVRPPGALGAGPAGGVAHGIADAVEQRIPAAGEPDGLTVVDAAELKGLDEAELEYEGVSASVTYPVLPNAEPLSDFLRERLGAEVAAFDAANPGAESYEAEWNVTAAADGLVGVRMTSVETDSEGAKECHATYWYDIVGGRTRGSQSLLAGQKELAALNTLVRDRVGDAAETGAVLPVASLYDSVGFNPDGDLVVEFDAGQVAAVDAGPVTAVVERADAEPLLSEFGLRALRAATTGVEGFAITAAPEEIPEAGEEVVPGIISPVDASVDCASTEVKCVALTYDDGPGGRTPELLDMLAEHDAKATFFVTGLPVMENPRTVRRAYAEGHEIANHTLSHPDLAGLGADGVRSNLNTVQALVYRETGYTMDLMRPPYGSTNGNVASVTGDMGLAQIMWSIDTNDWKDRDASVVAGRAISGASDGAIILMHDIHDTTIDASREIIRELDARGYTMVTVSQLLGEVEPGESYVAGAPDAPPSEGPSDVADPDSTEERTHRSEERE
ncbi:polysaccharide deacetylase family protein [Nocardiopsis lambiniae]|uniref:Polysaccharide deacetylase family protein n=1 Tax=Nocardiopsis lambiniae TaxID=3075539 RepID=A0ABU2M3V4_9ACTN|nr:polysaccharide deacetylase family protein [Nocardiopsis sp. DSM 44743]MDT0327331.1 polysaccharide deacetylase family protein [Nocardiopsis sp. DSM 44743]